MNSTSHVWADHPCFWGPFLGATGCFMPHISRNYHSEQMALVTYWGRTSRTESYALLVSLVLPHHDTQPEPMHFDFDVIWRLKTYFF